MNDLSNFQRGQIVGARMAGSTVTTTARLFNVSRSTVSKVLLAYQNHGKTSSGKHKSGRKTKLTDRDRRLLEQIVAQKHQNTAAKVTAELNSYLAKPVSTKTVRRELQKKVPRLSTMSLPCPMVVCGPSGSGKSTILKKLFEEYGKYLGFSISHTTRQPRPGEVNGREYHFVTRSQMEDGIRAGDFIEHTQFSGNLYGTSKKAICDVQNQGKICILDIEIEGVKSIKKTNVDPRYIFIKPESIQILEQRLRGRGTETEASLKKRLDTAQSELEYGEIPGNFDAIIVNDTVDKAYEQLKTIILPDIKLLMEK